MSPTQPPTRTAKGTGPRLGPTDWAEAGLRALAEGGLRAVAVEPVAARLGATKGSFYWHFADRAALVTAVLELWERVATEEVIGGLAEERDPRLRLARLFELTFTVPGAGAVDAALLGHSQDPLVAPVLERVTRRRLAFMAETVVETGVDPAGAEAVALQAYTAWIGLHQLGAAVPQVLPQGRARDRFADAVLRSLHALLPPPGTAPSPR